MRKTNVHVRGAYWIIPSVTEIMKAAAHLRALIRSTPENYFACEYYPETGKFVFSEFVDPHSYTCGAGVSYCFIPSMFCDSKAERKRICNGIVAMLYGGMLSGGVNND